MRFAITLANLLLLCGCRGVPKPVLTALIISGPEGELFKESANKEKEPVDVLEYRYRELYDALNQDLTYTLSGTLPPADLVLLDDAWFPQFADSLEDLPEEISTAFPKNCVDVCTPSGGTHMRALPFVGNVQLLFYNKLLCNVPPKTWDELKQFAQRAHSTKRAYGYVMRAGSSNAIAADFLPLLWAFGGDLDPQGNVPLTPGPAVQALKYMLQLASYAPPGYNGFEAEEVASHMKNLTAALSINWLAWKKDMPASVEFADLPAPNGKEKALLGIWVLGIPKNAPHKTEAHVFLAKMAQIAKTQFKENEDRIGKARPRPRTAHWHEIEDFLGFCLSQANVGILKPAEAVECAEIGIRKIVQGDRSP